MDFRVWFRDWNLGFRLLDLGVRIEGSVVRVKDVGMTVCRV